MRCLFPALLALGVLPSSLMNANPPATAASVAASATADLLSTLRTAHPRLLVSASTWDELKTRAETDPDFRTLLDAGLASARARLAPPPPERKLEGIRLLAVSRRVLADATWLSLAYRVTGERVFLEAAERNLLAAAAFPDWNPTHFLDVAEMTAAVALGYDWLYSDLSPATRATLRTALVEKGITPGLDSTAPTNWWQTREMNWNQVCLGGLTLGALAVADDEPRAATHVLELLRTHARHGLVAYSPDGIYPEGPSYWRYGTHYTVLTLAALDSALGTDALMPPLADFYSSARVQSLLLGPSGLSFNFADAGRKAGPDPLLFWFARRLGNPGLLTGQRAHYTPFVPAPNPVNLDPTQLFALLYWQTPPTAANPDWTTWHGTGEVPLAVFRGPDSARGAFYLAVKGGSACGSHAHLDGGSFVFELDGIRWAHDLGMQEYYPLEQRGLKIWDTHPGSDRWRIFRYTNQAHNTLTLDDTLHDPHGLVTLTEFSPPPAAGITADLTPVLAPRVTRATRRFQPHADARGFTVTDTLAGLRPGATVRWTLVTRAQVSLGENTATLRKAGRELTVRVAQPTAVTLSLASAEGPADFDEHAPGYRLLRIETRAPDSGRVTLEVELAAPAP